MAANVNAGEIQEFLRAYRASTTYGYPQNSHFNPRNEPRWSPQVTTAEVLGHAGSSHFDDERCEYTTSTVTSRAPTVFSRTCDQSSLGRHTEPSVGVADWTFVGQLGEGDFVPMRPGQILWCEFSELLECPATFGLDDTGGWIQHHIDHLGGSFPQQFVCWFCDSHPFTTTSPDEAPFLFDQRMQHVRQHIFDHPRLTNEHMRPDFFVIKHLRANNLLSEEMYQHVINYNEAPPQYQIPVPHVER
ncbi:hypothetical protein N0V88_000547 [Collariella sp. IMI 366227]|nr:hypothetical protein N0V88_000547 [Collariella sp. IMI 366227]